jgi:chitin synthase
MDTCGNKTISAGGVAKSSCPLPDLTENTISTIGIKNTSMMVGYDWDEVSALPGYMVVNGLVLNLSPYLSLNPNPIEDDPVDAIIRQVAGSTSDMGKDATKLFWNKKVTVDSVDCLAERFLAGKIAKTTPGECSSSQCA